MKRFSTLLLGFTLAVSATAQTSQTPHSAADQDRSTASPAIAPSPLNAESKTDFMRAADEVLAQMSMLLDLPIKEPLKRSLRSKQEIRAYLVKEEKEDRDDSERYADDRTLEAFGVIPQGFPLDSFMLDVMTDQVAGVYDPKSKEFYIADWIPADDQRSVMAHELTHALEDQSYHIEPWIKAAHQNVDAESARQAVSEGTALAAMVDYTLQKEKMSVRNLPDVAAILRPGAESEMDKDPNLAKAPPYIRDELLFPYLAGTTFSQQFLKAHSGWSDLGILFQNPPVSTQQIMHPDVYLAGVKPEKVDLPEWKGLVPPEWKFLEENVIGEFFLGEVLKQFLDRNESEMLASTWKGDRYAVFEDAKTKQTRLVFLIAFDGEEDAARFCGQYGALLELKYKEHHELFRRPNFFQFQTTGGGVYLHCFSAKCLVVEESTRDAFDKINKSVGLPAAPLPSASDTPQSFAAIPTRLSPANSSTPPC
jgi:hypothetical protein